MNRVMDGVHIDLSNIDIVFHDGLMEKLTSMCGEVRNEVYAELSEWSGTARQGCNQWHKGHFEEGVTVYPRVQDWSPCCRTSSLKSWAVGQSLPSASLEII